MFCKLNIFFSSVLFVVSLSISPDLSNISFLLLTKNNPEILFVGDNETLFLSDFKSSRKTVVLIHDWQTNPRSIYISPIINAYLNKSKNVIVLDWRIEASLSYPAAKKLSPSIGKYLAVFINFLIVESNAKPFDFHLIGYGLGTEIATHAARQLLPQNQISKITALNPSKNNQLFTPNIAKCVQIFSYATKQDEYFIGKNDLSLFYIYGNGTKSSFNLGCYYAEIVSNSRKILGVNCSKINSSCRSCLYNEYLVDVTDDLKKCFKGCYFISVSEIIMK